MTSARSCETVPEVLGCHNIRSRGSSDHVFVDLHIWMNPAMRLDEAHRVSHVVKDRIMARYPQVKDAGDSHRAPAESRPLTADGTQEVWRLSAVGFQLSDERRNRIG